MASVEESLAIALEHHRAGRLQPAAEIYRQVLKLDPNQADALHLLGVVEAQCGKNEVAADLIARAIQRNPLTADFHSNRAIACHRLGRLEDAAASFRRALELRPAFPEACHNLAVVLQQQGRTDEALASYRRALELKPDYADAHYCLAGLLAERGDLDAAIDGYRQAIRIQPDFAQAWLNLGNALKAQGKLTEALAGYERALAIKPDYLLAHYNLGNALKEMGRLDDAVACYKRALHVQPGHAMSWNNLGSALRDLGQLNDATQSYRRALEFKPDYPEAQNNLANVCKDQGLLDAALASFRRALELRPDFVEAHSNYLCCLQYHPDVTLAKLAAAHEEWDRRHAAAIRDSRPPAMVNRHPDRRLRLGFVSADLGRHPVGYFLLPVLENLDRLQFETFCYSDRIRTDDLTVRLQAGADVWRDSRAFSHDELAAQIRADEIDLLFDLAGHTALNRLPVFARKPAPVQITWIGYVGTTGLPAIDYIIADRHQVLPQHERYYREAVLRMPDSYVCYHPPADAPPVGPLPADRAGHVSFGSFNNPAKVTDRVIDLWAEILRRLPGSRLVLKARGLDDPSVRERYAARFEGQGIPRQRVELLGRSSQAQLLSEYNRVDIALDPFPYSGGLTTCEALWMGVPVITCPGETFASRHSLAHLSNVGLTETIARDLEQYCALAVALASDLPRLAALRVGLRQRVAASPLCDGRRFAANLAVLLRGAWRQWTGRQRGTSSPAAVDESLAIALDHHRAGRLEEAAAGYRRAIELQPDDVDAHCNLAMALKALGQLPQAVSACREALRVRPSSALAWNVLGNVLQQQGAYEHAAPCYQRALEIQPDFAEAYNNLGNALQHQGKFCEAVASYRQAIQRKPNYATALSNLGNALRAQGKLEEAAGNCLRAVELAPTYAEAHNNLGAVFFDQARFDQAIACCRRALELKPDYLEACRNLGRALRMQGRVEEAVDCYHRLLQRKPETAETCNEVGTALQALGRLAAATASYRRALEIQPDLAAARNNLANALTEQGNHAEAVEILRALLDVQPDFAEAHNNLGIALQNLGKLEEAIGSYRRALALNPAYPEALNNLGNAFRYRGEVEQALNCYEQALALRPDWSAIRSNYLVTKHYVPGVTLDELANAHADWAEKHAAPLGDQCRPLDNDRTPDRRLRLGFVSADFARHPVGWFLAGTLQALDRRQCEIFCYSDRLKKDDLTARLTAAASAWRETAGLSDEALTQQIRSDKIDILFDLAGHTANNRLLVFARQPSPIQVTWIGYVGTTGLGTIDYLLADQFEVPGGAESRYRERVLRLPNGYVCYWPPSEAPAVSPLPASRGEGVTFASFNNPAKINPDVVTVWAEILLRVPRSRLMLKYRGLDDPATQRRYRTLFAGRGVAAERILFAGRSPHPELLAEYNRVDIALDPFPYSGGLTTCEALWMGVPVVTCPGETFASRHSLSHLSNAGLTETIAQDLPGYVDLAVGLAGNLSRLAALRAGLRQRMASSPLCDAPRFAADLMGLLRNVWRDWCQSAPSPAAEGRAHGRRGW